MEQTEAPTVSDSAAPVSSFVDLNNTDQLNAVHSLCAAILPVLLAEEAQAQFSQELEKAGVTPTVYNAVQRGTRAAAAPVERRPRQALQVKLSDVLKTSRVTPDRPVVVDYSSSSYRRLSDCPELDLEPEEEEMVNRISVIEQTSLEIGVLMDWGTNTLSALASSNDKFRLFKYASHVPIFRSLFERLPQHVRTCFLSDEPSDYFLYGLRETPLIKPFLNCEQLLRLYSLPMSEFTADGGQALHDGDVLHVPFTAAEVDIVATLLPLSRDKFGELARRLPGRTAVDVIRFLQQRVRHRSLEQPELLPLPSVPHLQPAAMVLLGEADESPEFANHRTKLFGCPTIEQSFLHLGRDGNNIDIIIVFRDPKVATPPTVEDPDAMLE